MPFVNNGQKDQALILSGAEKGRTKRKAEDSMAQESRGCGIHFDRKGRPLLEDDAAELQGVE